MFSCFLCNKTFDDESNYKRHVTKSSRHEKKCNGETTRKKYQCNFGNCKYNSNDWSNMNKHKKKHSANVIQHKHRCLACEKTFRDRFDLNKHLNSIDHQSKLQQFIQVQQNVDCSQKLSTNQ